MARKAKTAPIGRPKSGSRAATHPYIEKHPNFPLSYHKGTGQFYKTFKGARYYFGPDPIPAKRKFEFRWSYIVRGLPIPEDEEFNAIRVGSLIDQWLEDRAEDVEDGKLAESTLAEYKRVGDYIAGKLGRGLAVNALVPQDFTNLYRAMKREWGRSPSRFKTIIAIARMPFRWGFEMAKIDAVRYGPRFKAPSEEEIDEARREKGQQDYTAEEVRRIIEAANKTLRAAVLLGINGGYTQKEVAELRIDWLDAEAGILDHLRGKTKKPRRVPLWPETLEAIKQMPKHKPEKSARGLLFVTRKGKPYHQEYPVRQDGIGQMFSRLTKKLDINRMQSGFGKLRATHRTVSDNTLDENACKVIMGHGFKGVDPNYIRRIGDARLRAVTDYVHGWLFNEEG